MSEYLASAASKMGVPEPLVRRAADARAKASGTTGEDILAAWAGGESAPAAAPPPPPAEDSTTPEPEPIEDPTATPEPGPTPEPAPVPAAAQPAVTTGPRVPPVLVGREERLVGVAAGAVALLAVSLLVSLFVASAPAATNLAYTSEFGYSAVALDGQSVYRSEGCVGCHTQVVRPVVADAGLGGVTMSDTNQIVGTRRIGPDLAHIGSRVETDADLYGLLDGGSGHPPYRALGQSDLDALVAYLMEST
ncbi:MAG TPA: cbb3-type cytochrome c oxidase subunit II [Acidimicrobiia bacterium]|nr:cbb3-type cytochrome c oxidase subunit II [Acidimicrobiia bacterium]